MKRVGVEKNIIPFDWIYYGFIGLIIFLYVLSFLQIITLGMAPVFFVYFLWLVLAIVRAFSKQKEKRIIADWIINLGFIIFHFILRFIFSN